MTFGVEANLKQVRQGILAACARAGRDPTEVTLVAVSKHQPTEAVLEALAAGQLDLGENYAQELRDKARALASEGPAVAASGPGGPRASEPRASGQCASEPRASGPRWHYIGPLQRNKVRYVVGTACLVHTLDSEKLLGAIEERAAALGTSLDVLLQVNLAEEPQKSGAALGEVPSLLDAFAGAPHVFCRGLMLMPPWDPDPEAARPLFAELRRLRDSLAATPRPNVSLTHLSMGMSHDFHVAIEEGATLVRVGTAIFGER